MEVIDELNRLKFSLGMMNKLIEGTNNTIFDINLLINGKQEEQQKIEITRQYYKKGIDIIYQRSIQELEDVLNSALSFIFTDKPLEVHIELNDKRGKSLVFTILHKGKRVSLKRGMGMGVKCVISAILHIYYLQCKNSKVLLLDEAYSNISAEYVSNFFEFISNLCLKLDFTLILITHDERFLEYGQRAYYISEGRVTLQKS